MKRIRMLLTASFTAFCLLSGGVNSLVAQTVTARGTEDSKISVYRGVVIDDEGDPLPGVSITIVGKKGLGTATNVDGEFSIRYDQPKCVIQFSYVGMKTQQVRATAGKRMTVQLETDAQVIGEAVANGIYTRNIESFTGSVSTFNSDDLKMISANNILKSLSALDPSIIMPENTLMGSDPNTMPKLTINGEMNPQALAQEYETDPNQPLFILDGFESTLQAINDLNMDRIESISILKDASATAIYGSKAANGVIVVETKKPEAGRLQLSYNGSLQFAWADLSDYNLMNSEQKLQFELLAGRFGNLDDNGLPVSEVDRNSYFDRRRLIDMGHETYWMNEPLRTAVTQTHNLYIQGGDQSFRYGAGLSYSKNEGVMKDSNRDVINGNVNLTYRVDNFSFTNQTTINHVGSTNETVPFSRFSAMSPFYPKYDEATGLPPKYVFYDTSSSNPYEWNPIWDMNQNSFKKGDITTITDNFQFEWRVSRQLRLRGNLQYQLQKTTNETYTSPNETSMHSVASDKKGSYTNSNSTANSYSGRLNATYGTAIGLHTINAVGGMQISERNNRSYSFGAAGYSSDTFWNPNFSNGYPENGKPTSTDSKTRNVSYYANGNYAYDMKYLLDFNWTLSGASQFGIDDPFTPTWSVGIGWNIHNESWFKTSSLINYLKVRASYGNPGNQNYDAKLAASIYKFMTEYTNPFGLSNIIEQWGNNGLKWQKTNTYNVGLTATMFDNRLSLNADYQIRKTDPQLVRIDLPGSTGVTSAPMNVGGTDNRSISLSATCYIIKKYNFNWYVSGNLNHYTTTYFGIGDVLQQYNEAGRISSSLARMYDGGSISGLYAVRSLGIDPATGNEMLLKKNGTPTYEWNAEDEVLVGDSNPDIQGNFSTSFLYKGFTFGASFSFKMGGDVTLNTLMDKIENISGDALRKNQDVRALTDRWKKPGDIAKYKRIDDTSTSHITTRFIKTENTFSCGSINIGYRTATAKFLNTIGATSFDIRFYMNDIFRISNIKEERGLSYPFQRSCSMSLGLSF
ncbi:MAG: SusC/RagA family TonB-linked outer membrane protein [Duncaniella sp.]|nr:SusC/RagA family TonB-linked outer membrane protein [Duncaniella sp.]